MQFFLSVQVAHPFAQDKQDNRVVLQYSPVTQLRQSVCLLFSLAGDWQTQLPFCNKNLGVRHTKHVVAEVQI